jgi:SnoaL-like domain
MDEVPAGLSDREEVSDLVTKLFVSGDERRWKDVIGCFSSKVLLDMASAGGGKASRTSPKRIAEIWESGVVGLASTHHQIGNILVNVEGDEAGAFCYATATHYFPNPSGQNVHTLVGTYDFHLSRNGGRWSIDAWRFNLKYEDGNLLLSEIAKKAAKRASP